MVKRLKPLHTFLLSFLITSCLREETIITTDFDYVKLTETKIPLSPFYCKGVIRGMPFSYSTNDNLYASTYFSRASDGYSNKPGLSFSIGNFLNFSLPILIVFESRSISLTDFLQNKLKINAEFSIGSYFRNKNNPDFDIFVNTQYSNQYIGSTRDFTCCEGEDKSVLKILNVEYFANYTAITVQFSGKLYSAYTGGDILYFGDADIEMRIRIDK